MQNLFSKIIPQSVLDEVIGHFRQGTDLLRPYLQSLTPKQRKELLKMGEKTVAFVQKVRNYARENKSFVPAFVDMKEFEQDADALAGLSPVHILLAALALDLESTMMLAGSDGYAAALVIYTNIKFLAKNNQPGAQAAYDDLSQQFPGSSNAGRKPSTSPTK